MVKCYICWKEHSVLLSRRFHSFPSDAERREKWFNTIGYTVDTYKNARICSDHFTEDDYYYSGTPIPSRRLKKTAIPSVFTQRSCRSSKKDTRSNIQNNNQNESLIDIEYESTMDIQHQSAIDVQQSTIDNHDNSTIQHDNLILAKPIVVENTVTHNNISRRRKRCNDMEKIFLKTGKYNIECIRKTEFATNQAWSKFVKYFNYNRYLHKLSVTRKSRVQKKIVTMQSVIQTLKSKNLIKTNVTNALKSEGTSSVIEVENVDATKTKEKRNTWSVNKTRALIGAVEARYDDMHHVHKRKNFWSVISEELGSQNIEVSELACKKKWQNLVLTYKNTKDVQSKTGRGSVKFTFYNRLDELLGDSPSSASPHSLDVNELQSQVEPTLNFDSDTSSERPSCSNDSSCMQKRKNPSMELVKVKKKFFEEKMEKIKEKEISRKLYVEESLKYKKEKLDLYKEKLEMEKKKIKALEDLQKILKEKKYIKY